MSETMKTPSCPLCSQPPRWVLAGGAQAFCATIGCKIVIWDMTMTMDELMNDIGFVDLSPFEGRSPR